MTLENPVREDAKTRYFSHFALSHMDAMRVLKKGKILGPESEGWRNVSEHCLLGGVLAYTLARLVELPKDDVAEVTEAALTHDSGKRLEREAAQISKTQTGDGRVIVRPEVQKTIAQEGAQKGLARVTGRDQRDFATWGTKEKILRYMDSCLATLPDGKAELQHWHDRFEDLRRRYPDFNVQAGMELYDEPLFDFQEKLTEKVETDLFNLIAGKNPAFAGKHKSSDLLKIVEGALAADIAAPEKRGPMMRKLLGAVVSSGTAVKEMERRFSVKEGEGHRSGVTSGDMLAQEVIFKNIAAALPDAKILSEEGAGQRNVFDVNDPKGILEGPDVVIIDPIDGTAPYANKLGTWCVGAGLMRYGELVGSAIYAPALNGGMSLVAEEGRGTYVSEWGAKTPEHIQPLREHTALRDCIVAMGVDSSLHRPLMSIVPDISPDIRAWTLANSGLLALAQVATGRLQAVIQTPQKAWDWAPAYRAVLESGMVFKFFRLVPDTETNDGTCKLIPIENYDDTAFASTPKENRLGFVAGEPGVAAWLFEKLPKTGWADY
ncbi:hypothetical protein A2765_00570 [Candidatus Kaiserbacteria bacterium RIFCSPHIGHO2_01_FULL_56_24]|uniref:HD domain-containing protein n=1 Tax=Candidatus Kaiserbacteria bacterium RIFCSPHIGHO2_01_FULL_56_24 TaxID=1798487 RepID=A0A1F6DBR4_9BACT|nr:MAG: hypothetical protein A2765_00570 [Candidatus Kaiserbacteria bacterium RIFCSPHIGHO2_01_FULL_56_24]